MLENETFERLRGLRLLDAVERQDVVGRRFRRRVGEFLAVGKDALKLDLGVEIAEQRLRRERPFERKRGMDEQDRSESEADARFHAPAGMR